MILYEKTQRLADAILSLDLLIGLDNYYPGFQYWFVNQAMPSILAGTDFLYVAKEHGRIIGVALGKKQKAETKLRCVRVHPAYRNRGVGLHLIDRVLTALDCDKPLCTVSEELMDQYSRPFINRYGFDLTRVEKGMYRRGKLEYIFNSVRDARPH